MSSSSFNNRLRFRLGSGVSKPDSSEVFLREMSTSKEGSRGSWILGNSISIIFIEGMEDGIATSAMNR